MKYVLALFFFVVATQAGPFEPKSVENGLFKSFFSSENFFFSSSGNGAVVSRSEVRDEYGQYSLTYQKADGVRGSERGVLRPFGKENVLIREGTYVYTNQEGKPITVNYVTDEKGNYHYVDHLPEAPLVTKS